MPRHAVTAMLLVFLGAPPARAGDLKGSRLFVNKYMKYDTGRKVGLGLHFSIAPVKAAEKAVLNGFCNKYPASCDVLLAVAQRISPEDIRGKSGAALKEVLKNHPGLTAEQRAAVDTLPLQDLNSPELVAHMLEIMQDPNTAITFSIEPFVEIYLGLVDLTVTVPMAGFASGGETDFALGNIGIDARFGHKWGKTISGGISYGLQLWTPTATEKANAMALANLLWSPRYFHEYMTFSPYFLAAVDLYAVTLQANVGYNALVGVKGNPAFDDVHYLEYGFALAVTAIPYIVISAELSGLQDLKNGAAYQALYLTSGVRVTARFVDIGVAAQVPLMQAGRSEYANFSGVSFGSPSDFNILLTMMFGI